MGDYTAAVAALVACILAFIIVALIFWKKFFSTIRGVCNCVFRTRSRNNHSRISNGNIEQDADLSESHMPIVVPETCGTCGVSPDPQGPCLSSSYSRFLAMRAQTVEDVVSPAACGSQLLHTLPITRREAVGETISHQEETGLIQKEDEETSPSASPLSIPVSTHKTVHIPYMAIGKGDVKTCRPPKIVGFKILERAVSVPGRTGAIPKISTSQIALKENNRTVEMSVSVPRIRKPALPREELKDVAHPMSFLINTGAIRVKQTSAFTDMHNSVDRDVGLVLKARDVSIDVPQEASLELEKARKRFLIKRNKTAVHQEESSVKIRNGFLSSLVQKKKMGPRRTSRLEIDGVFRTSNYKSYKKVVKNQFQDRKENTVPPTELIDLPPERIESLRKKRLRNQTIQFRSVEDLVKEDERLQVACTSPGPSTSRGTLDH